MIIFDLDGTLADITHRLHFVKDGNRDWDGFFAACVDDKPIQEIIDILVLHWDAASDLEIWSGRSGAVRTKTEVWLQEHTAIYDGLTDPSKAGPVWNGTMRLNEKALTKPLHWREPRTIFVNSMGDLFHENAPDEWVDRVFAVMALTPQHTYQILTKRPDRQRDYLLAEPWGRINRHATAFMDFAEIHLHEYVGPLPNVWLGTSVEDEPRAERIDHLRNTPAAVRLLSMEPLLGPVEPDLTGIGWVIVGGESGPNARPMHPDWARSLRDQCVAAGVPYFFKQWGDWAPHAAFGGMFSPSERGKLLPRPRNGPIESYLALPHDMPETDGGLNGAFSMMRRVGKKVAGRDLDGRVWDQYPEDAR